MYYTFYCLMMSTSRLTLRVSLGRRQSCVLLAMDLSSLVTYCALSVSFSMVVSLVRSTRLCGLHIRPSEFATSLKRSRRRGSPARKYYIIAALVAASLGLLYSAYLLRLFPGNAGKPVILYVNQGNGIVDGSNFAAMLTTARSHGFNTIFFQVYRAGNLLFNGSELGGFVTDAHAQGVRIFFALYFTSGSQILPQSIYSLGEDGISLDMSTLPPASQQSLFGNLQAGYRSGVTAITTTDASLALKPEILVLETYAAGSQGFIRHGIIASVGVFATASKADYDQQFQYALNNSDGVMVFDYAGLVKSGY